MKRAQSIFIAIALFVSLSSPPLAEVIRAEGWCRGGTRPYGDYCPGGQWGRYGAKRSVKSREEAQAILREYFKDRDVRVGKIHQRKWFFKAEILDAENRLIDIVIIDRRTGRIRSIY